jgi:hypothetical protein
LGLVNTNSIETARSGGGVIGGLGVGLGLHCWGGSRSIFCLFRRTHSVDCYVDKLLMNWTKKTERRFDWYWDGSKRTRLGGSSGGDTTSSRRHEVNEKGRRLG